MANIIHILVLSALCMGCHAQNYPYATYSNPYQSSFAFATPNLKQMFTTRLASPPSNQALSQASLYAGQPQFNNLFQQNLQNVPSNYPQYQQQNLSPNNNFYTSQAQNNQYPQTFHDDQLQKQLAYMQLRQQQQRDSQLLQQFQAPFVPSSEDVALPLEQQKIRTQQLLGVSYSPSTQVSQVKFDSAKLKYDF